MLITALNTSPVLMTGVIETWSRITIEVTARQIFKSQSCPPYLNCQRLRVMEFDL